jgi:hypothetical protein
VLHAAAGGSSEWHKSSQHMHTHDLKLKGCKGMGIQVLSGAADVAGIKCYI